MEQFVDLLKDDMDDLKEEKNFNWSTQTVMELCIFISLFREAMFRMCQEDNPTETHESY
jgi:hypothetical protein